MNTSVLFANTSQQAHPEVSIDFDKEIERVKFPKIRYESPYLRGHATSPVSMSCTSNEEFQSLLRCNITHKLGVFLVKQQPFVVNRTLRYVCVFARGSNVADPQDKFPHPITETQKVGWLVPRRKFGEPAASTRNITLTK